jgi:hypothetical protein
LRLGVDTFAAVPLPQTFGIGAAERATTSCIASIVIMQNGG